MDKVDCALSSVLLDVYKTFRRSNSGKEKCTFIHTSLSGTCV